ncbi:Halomucin, partial [Colletotrichum sp. SAR11_59]
MAAISHTWLEAALWALLLSHFFLLGFAQVEAKSAALDCIKTTRVPFVYTTILTIYAPADDPVTIPSLRLPGKSSIDSSVPGFTPVPFPTFTSKESTDRVRLPPPLSSSESLSLPPPVSLPCAPSLSESSKSFSWKLPPVDSTTSRQPIPVIPSPSASSHPVVPLPAPTASSTLPVNTGKPTPIPHDPETGPRPVPSGRPASGSIGP